MRSSLVAIVALLLISIVPAPAADDTSLQADVKALVDKIHAKFKAGERSEAKLAAEFHEFDALLAKHDGEKTDAVANILFTKAMLYLQFFDDTAKATAILDELKTKYPDTKAAAKADSLLAKIKSYEAGKKVRASLVAGSQFPDFTVTDLEGKPLSISALKGKIVLIDFWATWCGPCVHELPNVLAIYEKYHAKGFDIIGISLDKDKAALTSFLESHKMTWPQYFDGKGWSNELAQKYGVNSIPFTCLLDKDGKILAIGLRGEELDAAVAKATVGK